MSLDEDTLEDVARNGEMDYARWPAIIEPLLHRLNHIVYNKFPLPRPYPTLTPNVSTSSESTQQHSTQSGTTLVSQTPTTPRTLPPVPPFPGSASSTSQIPNSQPEPSHAGQTSENESAPTPELPLLLAQLLAAITNTLRTSFTSKPPHTIQRLAELILHPNNHYRTLPSYLRALDRVVSVSSTADIFPLSDQPPLVNGVTNGESIGGILWKNDVNGHEKARESELGSDESLGGALLTPIPWLRDIHPNEKESLDSNGIGVDTEGDQMEPLSHPDSSGSAPNTEGDTTKSLLESSHSPHTQTALATPYHDPLVPERQDGAVTQGELIRMEQEAGVVPVTHSTQSAPIRSVGRSEPISSSIALGVGVGLDDLEDDDGLVEGAPHARGPDVVGTVDMGLVGGRDVQVRIGSPPDEGIHERGTGVNVNDAQEVLEGSEANEAANRRKGSSSENSYVDVGKEVEGNNDDEMQVDSIETPDSDVKEKQGDSGENEDEDIVLVDADGAIDSDRERIDEVGGQQGDDGTAR